MTLRSLALVVGRHGSDCYCPRCRRHARPWMAHPAADDKRRDDLRTAAGALWLLLAIVAATLVEVR